jgi:hypothetical protein
MPYRILILTLAAWLFLSGAAAGGELLQALRFRSTLFLKVPGDLPPDAAPFTLARKAPEIDFLEITGLPALPARGIWSSWGDGCFASNGRYYTSIGNHLGVDGDARVYEYDPDKRTLRQLLSVQQVLGHQGGRFGHGKIHTRIEEMPDGWLYFGTYWGTEPKEEHFAAGFPGGFLMRCDPRSGRVENLGALVPKNSFPASNSDPARSRVFFYAVNSGDLVVYNTASRRIEFRGGGEIQNGSRCILLDRSGSAYFSTKTGHLARWDAASSQISPTKAQLPAGQGQKPDSIPALRAATPPLEDGTILATTHPGGQLFRFDPRSEQVTPLGPTFGSGEYTTVLALSPDQKYLYYAPGAHGSAVRIGVPIVQYEIATGRRKVLAFLGEFFKERGYLLGGCYNLKLDPKGERIFLTCNGGTVPQGRALRDGDPWNRPCVLVLHIPAGERK